MTDSWLWIPLLGLAGAIFGSFLATLAIRWPRGGSVLRGRSRCDACGAAIGARDLVPLLSVVFLRGQCRRCGMRIDPRHVQIETAAVLIGMAAGAAVMGPVALAGAVFGWLLLTLAAIDIAEYWLPDPLTLTLALAGVATGLMGIAPSLTDRLIGGGVGFAALWTIGFVYERLRGREGLGGGDPKLLGAIGLWLGWQLLPAVLLLAAATGLAVVLARKLRGGEVRFDDAMPFGALLAIAAYPAWLLLLGSQP